MKRGIPKCHLFRSIINKWAGFCMRNFLILSLLLLHSIVSNSTTGIIFDLIYNELGSIPTVNWCTAAFSICGLGTGRPENFLESQFESRVTSMLARCNNKSVNLCHKWCASLCETYHNSHCLEICDRELSSIRHHISRVLRLSIHKAHYLYWSYRQLSFTIWVLWD